jgi:TRAP-type C4-dicarboxylate transport system substrate-binding protein
MKAILLTRLAIGVAACGALAASIPAVHAEDLILRFNRWVPPTHHVHVRMMEPWAKQVAEVTKGRVKIEFTTSSLGAPPRQFDLAAEGVADVTFGNHDYTPARFVLTSGAQLPFLSDSAEALSVALWRTQQKYFEPAKEHAGVKLLALFVHGPGHVFTGNREVIKLADFAGLKLRSVGPITAEIAKHFGAAPVSAPATQAYELLSRGVADGTFFHSDGLVSFKLEKLMKHQTRFPGGLYNSTFFLVMNEGKWNRISPEDQRAIMTISGEAFARMAGKIWDEQDVAAAREMEKVGTKVTVASGALLDEAKAKLKDLESAWVRSAAAKNVDAAVALAFLRAEVGAYKPQ